MRSHLEGYRYHHEIAPTELAFMTDWMLHWHHRDKAFTFSLLLVDFYDTVALGNALGAAYAMDLIHRVSVEIAEVLRHTDVFSRPQACSFLMLLPHGSPDLVLHRIEPILSAAQKDGLEESHLHIGKMTVPDDLQGETSAVALFDRLLTNKH